MEHVMRLKHAVAAGLVAILLAQSSGLAQTTTDSDIRRLSQEEAVQVLLANLRAGADVRIELVGGDHVEGRLMEKSGQELIVVEHRQRRIVALSDVVSVRVPMKTRMTGGKAFRLGAGISFGVVFGAFLAIAAGLR
jgi:hypothetical protein